jgi:2-polyprenyl-3-methyl-5-hydroxy-6-metoxy-1,4-benzoquinol methylase
MIAHTLARLRIAGWTLLAKRTRRSPCPSCRSMSRQKLGRVRVVFESARCTECGLVYRIPTDSPPSFYSRRYLENTVWWREYESGALARDAEENFRGTKWDYYDKISLIRSACPGGRVLDFGGGSGVIASQLRTSGYEVSLFEVSPESGEIARDLLRLDTITEPEVLRSAGVLYDVILLHHVLEHVDDLPGLFALLNDVLAPGGMLWIFVPNGGAANWHGAPWRVLDASHICAFEPEFFGRNLTRFGFEGVTFSTPYAFDSPGPDAEATREARGNELALVAWREGALPPEPFRQWPYRLPDLRGSVRAQAGC